MTPGGNLFSNPAGSNTATHIFSSGPLFGSQTATRPAATSGQSSETAPTSGSLFGSSAQRTSQANQPTTTGTGLFGSSTGGLFAAAPLSGSGAQGASGGGLFGSMLGSSSTQQPTATSTTGGAGSLFGTSGSSGDANGTQATVPQLGTSLGATTSSSLFKSLGASSTSGVPSSTEPGSATEPAENASSRPTAATGATEDSAGPSSGGGTLGLGAAGAPGSSLLGSATSKATKPQGPASANLLQVPAPSKTISVFSKDVAVKEKSRAGAPTSILDASQYERLDQLLRKWESRVQRQISDFSSIAETVMNLDLDLCAASSRLASMQLDQQQIAKKQQGIDEAMAHTEMQQQRLAEMLQQMEAALSAGKLAAGTATTNDSGVPNDECDVHQPYPPAPTSSSPSQLLQNRLHSFSSVLDDTESFIQELTDEVNAIQAKLYPGAIGEILDLLNVQQLAIARIEDDAQLIRERLKQVHYHLQ